MATQVIKKEGIIALPSTAGLSDRVRIWSGKFLQALSGYLWSTEDSDSKYLAARSAGNNDMALLHRLGIGY